MASNEKANVQRKEDESACPVCHEWMEIFAVGRCDHTICYRCAVRMRVLCDQMYCAICRADLLQVLFLRQRQKFEEVDTSSFCVNRQYKIFSEDADIDMQYQRLLEHRCKLCLSIEPFRTFQNLRDHIQREHILFYCDLCVNNLKLFTVDRKLYNRAQLGHHRRHGDEDDRSYKGHPLCQFCDERYFDNDDLLRHLRKQHFYCHICESNGVSNEYFSDYVLLREHFKSSHILCEEGECLHAEFTNVFRSDIDYRAHWAQKHSAGVGRQQVRQMRHIDISVDFGDGSTAVSDGRGRRGGHQRGGRVREDVRDGPGKKSRAADADVRQGPRDRREVERKRREEIDQAHALSVSLADVQKQGHISVIDRQLAQHPMMMSALAAASSETSAKYRGVPEDFPSLDGAPQSTQQADESQQASVSENLATESATNCPRMSLAKKLAMSSRLSVCNGPMDFSDFPSLVNSKAASSRKVPTVSEDDFPSLSGVGKADLGKKATASVWNASDKDSTDDVRPSSHAGKSKDVLQKNFHDFPSLASTTPGTDKSASLPTNPLPVNSFASISQNFSSSSLSKLNGQLDTASWSPAVIRKADDHKEKEPKQHSKKNKKSGKSTTQEAWGGVTDHVKQTTSTSKAASNSVVSAAKVPEATPAETTTGENNKESRHDTSVAESPGWTCVGYEKINSDDFPILVSTASVSDKTASLPLNSVPVNSLASISRNLSTGSLSKLSNRMDTALNFPSHSWGPELNHKSDDHKEKVSKEQDSMLHLKKSKKSGKSATQEACGDRHISSRVSNHVKQATSTSKAASDPIVPAVTVPEVVPTETSAGDNDEESRGDDSTAESPRWTQVGSGKKTQSKPSKKNGDAKKNGAKLPTNNAQAQARKTAKPNAQSEDCSFPAKNSKDKSKKKQKTGNAQKESAVKKTSLDDAAKAFVEPDANDNKSVAEKGDSDAPRPLETSEKFNQGVASGSDESVTAIEKPVISGSSCYNAAGNGEGTEAVQVVDNDPVIDVAQSSVAAAVPVFSADNFPSLTQRLTVPTLPSLPPGFSNLSLSSSKPRAPPPGFSNLVVPHCPPPGLSSVVPSAVVLDADAVSKTDAVDSEVSALKYIPPRDMQQRSSKLVSCISNAVKDGSLGEFRELSEKFRAGSISAFGYHGGCCSIMDSIAFTSIFPELIALLPDIPKQNQLLKVHRDFLSKTQRADKTRSWCATSEDGLVSCVVCGQVLCHVDLQDHASEHGTFNADYPTLPNTSLCSVR